MKFRFYLLLFCLLLLPVSSSAESLRMKIKGVDKELQKILDQALVLPPSLVSEGIINKAWLNHYRQQLPDRVSAILEPYGYFHSQVSSQVKETKPGEYRLRVKIKPGTPLKVTSLNLKVTGPGADLPELQQLLKDFPLHVGDILRQDLYEEGKGALLQGVINLGYFDAAFQRHQILVDRDKQQVNIILHLESKVRFRFGETIFKNRGDYLERFLRRYLTYQKGDYFSRTALNQTRRKLRDANLFRTIEIHPLRDQAEDHQIPIQISLESSPRHQFFPGIGYGTDSGARGSLRYRNRNLFHRGHEFQGDLRISEEDQYFITTYTIPDLDSLDRKTRLTAGIKNEDNTSYESDKLFYEGEYVRTFRKNLTASLFLHRERERYWIGNDNSQLSHLLVAGGRLNLQLVDNLLTPQRGVQTRLELKGGTDALFSDISLLQLTGNITTIHPLPQQLSLLLRLRGGTTWHSGSFNHIPASLRFFPGGSESIRGYKYKSLGPKDDEGQVIGGKHQLIANIELERKITPDWGIVLFTDVGNSFNSFSDYQTRQGAGAGLNYYTTVGAIHIALARPIDGHGSKYRLSLSMGAEW